MGRGARVGAAVVVAGMSLAGPLVGVAAADTGEADGASVSAGAGDGRGGAQQAGRRESRTDRVARAASSASTNVRLEQISTAVFAAPIHSTRCT